MARTMKELLRDWNARLREVERKVDLIPRRSGAAPAFPDTDWTPVTWNTGYQPRVVGGVEMGHVRRKNGIVYSRIQIDATVGDWTATATPCIIPEGFRAGYEVRWLGFRTGFSGSPIGGWVSSTGVLTVQVGSNTGGPIANHFAVLPQPWIAAA